MNAVADQAQRQMALRPSGRRSATRCGAHCPGRLGRHHVVHVVMRRCPSSHIARCRRPWPECPKWIETPAALSARIALGPGNSGATVTASRPFRGGQHGRASSTLWHRDVCDIVRRASQSTVPRYARPTLARPSLGCLIGKPFQRRFQRSTRARQEIGGRNAVVPRQQQLRAVRNGTIGGIVEVDVQPVLEKVDDPRKSTFPVASICCQSKTLELRSTMAANRPFSTSRSRRHLPWGGSVAFRHLCFT